MLRSFHSANLQFLYLSSKNLNIHERMWGSVHNDVTTHILMMQFAVAVIIKEMSFKILHLNRGVE